MKYSIYPDQLKFAIIKPLFKKGDPDDLGNYRPISLLPAFSKIFEMVMISRLLNFMNEHNIFSKFQHGYLKGKSTNTAIYQFINAILNHLENKHLALGLFIDLSKAFDCVNHELLLLKLDKYGIRGRANEWIRSFLTNRKQQVSVDKSIKSDIKIVNTGIAQGSIAGPILFIVFINDLPSSLDCCLTTNYVDDTNILVGRKNIPEVLEKAETIFINAKRWFDMNKLKINESKTNLMLFRTKQSNLSKPEMIEFENHTMYPVITTKFLGVNIDEFLNWETHISQLCLKLGSIGYGIKTVANYMNMNTLKILYFANFESNLKYGIIFWGSNSKIQSVFIVQKRTLRTICKMKFKESCRGKFKTLSIMTVYGLYIYECLLFTFKNKNQFDTGHCHDYATRTHDLIYPQHRLTLLEKGPFYMCIKIFNKLPNNIKCCNSFNKFKKDVKNLLINLEPYNMNDYFNSENLV